MKWNARVLFGFFAALSLAAICVSNSSGQSVNSRQGTSQKRLGQRQINRLIASAKTPQDHQLIAEYYEEQAQFYENQSREYGAKIVAYEKTPYLNSCALCVTSSYSLEAAVHSLRISKQWAEERADAMEKLAAMHEQMSNVATIPGTISGL